MATSRFGNGNLADTGIEPGFEARIAQDIAQFTSALATELQGEALELPSFPEVALRVRKALGNADIAIDEVVRMVSAEPSLAVRLLQLANSAALNPGGQRITALRLAISRIGFNLARSATIAFAMSQMRRAEAWRGLERRFRELWEESASLAAVSHALAKRVRGVVADQAMLAGMLHTVGKLFLLTRLSRFPGLLNTPSRYGGLEREWHGKVARAILRRWDMSPEIVAAACDFEQAAQPRSGTADLRDVLFAARCLGSQSLADSKMLEAAPFRRLQLDAAACAEVLSSSAEDIASLRAVLLD
jgi:HD-like signal output (HDOD) protein